MIYKRKGEELTKQCENCATVWRDSWLERHQNENECPMCGVEHVEQPITVLLPIKDKPKDKMYYRKIYKAEVESKIEILESELIALESTGIFCGAEEYEENFSYVRTRHVKDLGRIKLKRIQLAALKMKLADVIGQIDKLNDIYMGKGEKI